LQSELLQDEQKMVLIFQDKEKKLQEKIKQNEKLYLRFLNQLNKKDDDKNNKFFSDFKAKSVLIKEMGGGVIFSKNAGEILPIASITKIITAITAIEDNRGDVVVSRKALSTEGKYGLVRGEKFSLKDAISFMLIRSVNDIASAIALGNYGVESKEKSFIKKMNDLVHSLGIKSTLLFSETGLDYDGVVLGSYSSAKDIAKIVEYFYTKHPDFAIATSQEKTKICSNKKCHIAISTNKLLKKYPEIKFSKTGYTRKSGGAVTVVVNYSNKNYIIVVLGSTIKERMDDLEKTIIGLKFYLQER
jgi:D-alanyl-D-alanine carboxypeptidase